MLGLGEQNFSDTEKYFRVFAHSFSHFNVVALRLAHFYSRFLCGVLPFLSLNVFLLYVRSVVARSSSLEKIGNSTMTSFAQRQKMMQEFGNISRRMRWSNFV
uniref:Uncharacterized protein n=1 Tax=Bactrocera dorsalis TaxID=27457 RepID=A0A034VS61_BACDO